MANSLSKCDLVLIIRNEQLAIKQGSVLLAVERIQIDADTAQFGMYQLSGDHSLESPGSRDG
jgi:hypothetical protein